MSETFSGRAPAVLPAGSRLAVGALAAIALALLVLAWEGLPAPSFTPAGPIGGIQAVTLANGQIFFGTLKSSDARGLVLTDVFDIATNTNEESKERSTQLIRRMTGSVYGARDMAVPLDKILMTETVGPDSTVAKAIASMKAAAEKASSTKAPDTPN